MRHPSARATLPSAMASPSGKLQLLADAVRVSGSDPGATLDVPYGDLSGVWLEHRTLVLERRNGEIIRVRSAAQPRILFELARRLARFLQPKQAGRSFAVIVPLTPGTREQARQLIEHGPPFDPKTLGVRRHEVFLSDNEAVFVFESPVDALEELLAEPRTLTAAAAWRDCVGGLARIADEAYSWESPPQVENQAET
jgi:hypothetical protein